DARQGYRGPAGHLDGARLTQYRWELKLARDIGRGDDAGKAAAEEAKRSKRPIRFNLRPIRDVDVFEGVVERVVRDPTSKAAKLVVDMGGRTGAVDLSQETRYAHGPKPLADRFRPGDLVRARFAPERRKGPQVKDEETPLAL